MNPALYNLPVKQCTTDNLQVNDSEGMYVAEFCRSDQAADFVAALNQHGPRKPKQIWGVWNKTQKRWMKQGGLDESMIFFYSKESATRAKNYCPYGSVCEWVVVNLADIPME